MELINNFQNLSKILTEKFHLRKSDVSLYLLALIYDAFDLFSHFWIFDYHEIMAPESYGISLIEDGILDSDTFRSIKDSGLINLSSFSKNEICLFSEYLIAEYFRTANISPPSSNFLSYIANIAAKSALELKSLKGDKLFNEWTIYVTNSGTGEIIGKLVENLEKMGRDIAETSSITAVEPNLILSFISEFSHLVYRFNQTYTLHNDNPLKALGITGFDDDIRIAISLPPFVNIDQLDLQKLYEFIGSNEKIHFSELAYIELLLKKISDPGKIIAVVRNDFLFSQKSRIFREKYLRNNWIEKIIALPKEYVNHPIDISVIVFNKFKIENDSIIFDGLEDKFEETIIRVKDVLSNDSDLRVSRYALKESKEVESILSKYPQDEVKKIKDLITSSISGFNYSPKDRITENSIETLPYVRVADLLKTETEFDLDISKVERKISREKAHKKTIIDFSAVLVSKIAPNLKPTYFNFAGQPIVIGSDVIALKLKEDINAKYFLTQLHSRLVQIQAKDVSSGATIQRIKKEDLLNIEIILPNLAEQELKILEMRGVIEEKALAQEQLSIAKDEIETTEYDVIAAITHNLNQKLGQIVDDYGTLLLFLQNKEKNEMPIIFDEMLRSVRNGELIENVPTFSKVANRLKNNLLDTAYTMKTTENILQKSSIEAERLDIINFFKKSIKSDFESSHFTLKIESRLKSLIVLADINALKDAFRNLIENAKKHGFTQSDQKYQIVFEISKYTDNSGDNFARIVYKNNGNPFPKSYRFEDYTRLGTRMGKNKGTGIGGFFVKKVIDLHKGSFKEITLHENSQELFQVQMEILLPLAD